jgi:hypothetical protein
MNYSDLKFFNKTYAGDTRTFFTFPAPFNNRYSGYVSEDRNLYFVLDANVNAYKDYTRAQLDEFLSSLGTNNETAPPVVNTVTDFVSNLTMSDGGKIKTGLILLGVLAAGFLIIKNK